LTVQLIDCPQVQGSETHGRRLDDRFGRADAANDPTALLPGSARVRSGQGGLQHHGSGLDGAQSVDRLLPVSADHSENHSV
jgi:hypothetical protein